MLRVETISDFDGLAALAQAWWELWRRTPTASFFQSPAWLLSWWRSFAPGDLRFVVVSDSGAVVAVAPFYLETGASQRRLLPLGMSVSDYLDVLLEPSCTEDAAGLVVEELGLARDWDTWELEELPPDAAALYLPRPPGAEQGEATQSACPVLVLPDRPNDLPAVVPKHKLRNARQACARAVRRGGLEVERVTPRAVGAALELLFVLHAKRWNRSGEAGVLASSEVQQLHRRFIADRIAAEFIRFYIVRIAGAPAAVLYGFMHAARFYAYLIGVDPDYAFESPGTIAVEHVITDATRDGAREFHFLRGREPYKYSWGATDRWNRHRSFRRPGLARPP